MYKLINKKTGQETLCKKVTKDGLDYYVSDEFLRIDDYGYWEETDIVSKINILTVVLPITKKVIGTNNINIDIPKVMDDELTIKVNEHFKDYWKKEDESEMKGDEISTEMMTNMLCEISAFMAGYKKSQETHPFSEEDMIEFSKFCSKRNNGLSEKEIESINHFSLLMLWKEQQLKTIYYDK